MDLSGVNCRSSCRRRNYCDLTKTWAWTLASPRGSSPLLRFIVDARVVTATGRAWELPAHGPIERHELVDDPGWIEVDGHCALSGYRRDCSRGNCARRKLETAPRGASKTVNLK